MPRRCDDDDGFPELSRPAVSAIPLPKFRHAVNSDTVIGCELQAPFSTYRGWQRWVLQTLDRIKRAAEIARLINVGCGEGDIDRDLREYSGHLVSLDINPQDVMHARALNADTADIRYIVADGDYLPFEGATLTSHAVSE
jgi:SAM-dependent methyltransferase